MKSKRIDIVVILFLVAAIAVNCTAIVLTYRSSDYPYVVIDTKTVSISKRMPIRTRTVTHEFKPGDTLATKENGAIILWDKSMGREFIYAIVSDSGTIELYYE
jgi:hypothetical protein